MMTFNKSIIQNVDCIKVLTISKYRFYQNVDFIKMSILSKCRFYQNVNCVKMTTQKISTDQNVEQGGEGTHSNKSKNSVAGSFGCCYVGSTMNTSQWVERTMSCHT